MITYARALAVASICHADQEYSPGEPYVNHCIRVASALNAEEEKIIALLHDTLEDTPLTPYMLRRIAGYRITFGVIVLTRQLGEQYWEYINRLKRHRWLIPIKIADLKENLRHSEQKPQYASLIHRYTTALTTLEGELHGYQGYGFGQYAGHGGSHVPGRPTGFTNSAAPGFGGAPRSPCSYD